MGQVKPNLGAALTTRLKKVNQPYPFSNGQDICCSGSSHPGSARKDQEQLERERVSAPVGIYSLGHPGERRVSRKEGLRNSPMFTWTRETFQEEVPSSSANFLMPSLDYILKPPLDYVERQSDRRQERATDLEQLIQDKLRTLVEIILDIEIEVRKRGELSLELIRGIERHYSYVKSKIFALECDPASESRRLTLEKQLDALHTEIRREQLQEWQDAQPLKRELRQWVKQYRDLKERTQLIVADALKSWQKPKSIYSPTHKQPQTEL